MHLPILFRHLPTAYHPRLIEALGKVEVAQTVGSINNVVFQDAKHTINRAIERVWDRLHRAHLADDSERAFWHQIAFLAPQLHTITPCLRKIERMARSDLQQEVFNLLTELSPLAQTFRMLKTQIVKREPKPVEERKPGYHPPVTTSRTQREVVALLETITEESYRDLRAMIERHLIEIVTDYAEHAAIAADHGFALDPYEYFVVQRAMPKYESYRVVSKVGGHKCRRFVIESDWQQRLAAMATEEADTVRTGFVHKNFRKIASVIEEKGNNTSATVLGRKVDLGGLTGHIRFTFADGSAFTVVNQVIWVRNQRNTVFRKFPLTFRDVVLASGQRITQPSEEKMNTIFAKEVAL